MNIFFGGSQLFGTYEMNLHYFLTFIRERPINEFLNFTFGFSFCNKIQIPRNGIIRIVDRGLLSIGFYSLYLCLAYKGKAKLTYACWIFGDFFQYTDHKKIYMINTNDASLDPDDWGGAPTTAGDYLIFPSLIKNVSTQNIKFNDLSVQVVAIGETTEVDTDRDGYFVYEREVREVY